jgi:hypothetical protein
VGSGKLEENLCFFIDRGSRGGKSLSQIRDDSDVRDCSVRALGERFDVPVAVLIKVVVSLYEGLNP